MTFRILIGAAVIGASSISALAISSPALAQDQGPTPGSSPWDGWYIGANLGMNWGDTHLRTTVEAPPSPPTPTNPIVIPPSDVALLNTGGGSNNKTGFTGGIEGGYNMQAGMWLLGVETDFVGLDVNQRRDRSFQSTAPVVNPPGVPTTYTLNERARTNWMWSLRPRVGVITGPWLFYGTAGIATSDLNVTMDLTDNRSSTDTIHSDDHATKTGWIAGLGAGYAMSPNWSLKGEWLYADFGSIRTTATAASGYAAMTSEAKVRSNLLRVGLDYRF